MLQKKQKLTYISLFSSAGVGCYGFKLEGFDCIATSELLEKRLNVQKHNQKCKYDTGYISGDLILPEVKNKIYKELALWREKESIKDVDVMIATPPCQGMSVANHKKKDELGRNSLVIESLKLIKEINPKFFILENVRAFLNTACTDFDGKDKSIKEAIDNNLDESYNIIYRVLNFKEYGNPSSRTRTLVIGARKDQYDVSPYEILPSLTKERTVREVVGDLPSLNNMGEIWNKDIYHNFRSYTEKMLDWIKDIKEGQSAFDNQDPKKRPHQIIDGKIVANANKNGDKYTRAYWDKVGPCVHTRNDILSSQVTVHPKDNRVFSIRELMRLMSIPDNFKWSEKDYQQLNKLDEKSKKKYLYSEEMNIRQCLGEAVPTIIFRKLAQNIKTALMNASFSEQEVNKIIKQNNLLDNGNLHEYLVKNLDSYSYSQLSRIYELANAQRLDNAAYYTRQDICYSLIKDLPDANKFEHLKILEPSVGMGTFLPSLIKKYSSVPKVEIDVVDIDNEALKFLRVLLKKISTPENIKINFINDDFLTHNFESTYDIVVGNPPFGKVADKNLSIQYKSKSFNQDTNNLFSFFIEKSAELGSFVALITPKSLLSAPEFNKTRELLSEYKFNKIFDYGEKGFKGVKIETVSMLFETKKVPMDNIVKIESLINNQTEFKSQDYIFSKEFPCWLIYRENFFDKVAKKLKFNIFKAYRDRQITKKHTTSQGKFRVLKSRNIINQGVVNIEGYDSYINDISSIAIGKFLNNNNAVLVPNLSYNPRATFLPSNSIMDGSVAVLIPKIEDLEITKKHLQYFSTDEFSQFYRIARNYGTRSLNIDTNSVFFWGILEKV